MHKAASRVAEGGVKTASRPWVSGDCDRRAKTSRVNGSPERILSRSRL